MYSIKPSGYRVEIRFEKDRLAVEQNNYLTKFLNVYKVYDFYAWPRNPNNNFKYKNFLFGSTSIVKNSDKEKYVYSCFGLILDSAGSWDLDNCTAWNVFSSLGKCPTFGVNGSFGPPKEKFSINFSKSNKLFCLSLHYNADNSCLFVNAKDIFSFKADNENVNFPTQLCLESICNGFSTTESREVSLNGNVYDFSVDYNSIDKSDILNIQKNLMKKNNIK